MPNILNSQIRSLGIEDTYFDICRSESNRLKEPLQRTIVATNRPSWTEIGVSCLALLAVGVPTAAQFEVIPATALVVLIKPTVHTVVLQEEHTGLYFPPPPKTKKNKKK